MESPNKGCTTYGETQPRYKPSNNYVRGARGRGKFFTESERAGNKDLREVLNKKRHENDSQQPLQMPSDPKYNFLADPMRNNDYIEPESNDSATPNNREFNSERYEDKSRGTQNIRWNRGGRSRGGNYIRKSYNNDQRNTPHKNEQTNIENTEFEVKAKHSQFRGNPRYNSYKKTGNNFSPKYSSDQSQNDSESRNTETLETDNVKSKFYENRPYRDQERTESDADGEYFGRTRFVKGRHSFRDNASKEEFADVQTRHRRGRHSFRGNASREQVAEGDNIGRPGFRGGGNTESKEQPSHEEHFARPRFDRGRRPYRGNYRGNYNRGGYNNNNRPYRKSNRDTNPVNISVQFSVETGDRKCTLEQMQKHATKKNEEIVIACEENWDEEKPSTTDKDCPEEEISGDKCDD